MLVPNLCCTFDETVRWKFLDDHTLIVRIDSAFAGKEDFILNKTVAGLMEVGNWQRRVFGPSARERGTCFLPAEPSTPFHAEYPAQLQPIMC